MARNMIVGTADRPRNGGTDESLKWKFTVGINGIHLQVKTESTEWIKTL